MQSAPETIEFTFQLTTSDFFSVLRRMNWRRLWFLLLGPIAGFFDLYFKATDPNRGAHFTDLGPLIGLCLFCGFMLVGGPYLAARSTMKSLNFARPIRYSFSASGIDFVATATTVHHDWSIVSQVQETADFILIFAPKGCLNLIPKAKDPDKISALRTMLRAHVTHKLQL